MSISILNKKYDLVNPEWGMSFFSVRQIKKKTICELDRA